MKREASIKIDIKLTNEMINNLIRKDPNSKEINNLANRVKNLYVELKKERMLRKEKWN